MTATYNKPLPRFYNDGSKEFYAGTKNHRLVLPRCASCGRFRFPPQRICPNCHSTSVEWQAVSGRGTIHTFTVIPRYEPRSVPMFSWPADSYPINVILVKLPDANDVHIVSNIVDCPLENLRVGMQVEVVFEDVTDEITFPRFRPVNPEDRGGVQVQGGEALA
jgi:uncharacterized OB-fold protein